MNRRIIVLGTAAVAVSAFGVAAWYATRTAPVVAPTPLAEEAPLIRAHSPVLGPRDAPVTIVEFFDPACEACRAFHPIVKQIMGAFPGKVRVILRYTPFHDGSDEAVRILEVARIQGRFEPVLEALYAAQPRWAHGSPRLDAAWDAAGQAGLDVEKGRQDRLLPGLVAVLNQDRADLTAVGVRQTPTFFVNGKRLVEFGPRQLFEMVQAEVAGR